MHIGLPYTIVPSDIGSGMLSNKTITLLTLANIFESVYGHTVTLICMDVGQESKNVSWWTDCEHLRSQYTAVMYNQDIRVDLILDIDCCMSSTLSANMNAQKVIGFRYDNCVFDELEEFTYMRSTLKHMAKSGVYSEIWVWDHNVDEQHVHVLEGVYGCPVKRVPFIWTPCMIRDWGLKDRGLKEAKVDVQSFCILGDNTGSADNSIVPLVGLNSLETVDRCHILGSHGIETSEFFQQNILQHLHFRDTITYAPRMQLNNIRNEDMIMSHLRFTHMLPYLAQIAWLYGERLIHNSRVLRDAGIEGGYYANNSVQEMIHRISNSRGGCEQHGQIQEMLERAWSPLRTDAMNVWSALFNSSKKEFVCSFSDMWDGFDPTRNFFLDLLRSRGIRVTGVNSMQRKSDMHICGPFGNQWKQVAEAGIPIVFFSGERWSGGDDHRIRLYLTHSPEEDDRHIRFPLWITYLSGLFDSESSDCDDLNPRRSPLSLATGHDHSTDQWSHRKFCAFVVSNPTNPIRNRAFECLNTFMPVSSGGMYRNTIGGPIEARYGGGGGGELAKITFFKDHKFCIAFENSSAPGYVTEKLLHAKMAGCIPIYWGDESALSDFDSRGFISMCGQPPEQIVERVQDLLDDPEHCAYMATIPALGERELDAMWKCIEKVGTALETIVIKSSVAVHKESSPDLTKTMAVSPVPDAPRVPLYVSYATKRFLPSIQQSLDTLQMIRTQECPGLQFLLYTGPDVQDIDCEPIRAIGSWIEIRTLPTDTLPEGCPESFGDFWNAHHFGWKLWILNQICHEFVDRLVVYSDAGAQWQRMYTEMFQKAWDTGACFILDHNTNRQWCSAEMIASMNVTEEELDGKQILGGLIALRGGSDNACTFFKECYELGLNPVNLRGRKLIRILPSGQPHGHRHDQSIMSVMRLRKGFGSTVDVESATCCESLRRTHLTGCPIYLHRGNYVINHAPLPRTDDVWIINLNRRIDRVMEWAKTYPQLAEITQRFQAIDGRELHITPALSDLFAKNDFKWKKSVMGCALSHILLWAQLASEGEGAKSYLIMEDDMRFTCGGEWFDELRDALHALPADVDIAYFGGILPNNKSVYHDVLESVNDVWSVITPNTLFTSAPLPVFHFCAYSYYLTQAGARKLLHALMNERGCFTSIDHFLGHPSVGLRRYVMTSPITGCYQESDPRYISSEFDNFDRVDQFDSDIWNNTDVFSDIDRASGQIYGTRLSLYPVFSDVLRQAPSDIQTRSLLTPMRYTQIVARDSQSEQEFMQGYIRILENESRNPVAVRMWQRRNVCVSTTHADCGPDVRVDVVEGVDEMETKCIRAKMFLVNSSSMTIGTVIRMMKRTGCIPIYVRTDGDDLFWSELQRAVPIVQLVSWEACRRFVHILLRDLRKAEVYRAGLMEQIA